MPPRVNTDIEDTSFLESRLIRKGILVGFLLAQAATNATASYSTAYSSTVVRDLSFAVQDFIQNQPQRSFWLNDCEIMPITKDTGSKIREEILAVAARQKSQLLIADLGWSIEEVIDTRSRLISFEEDWEAPNMEMYDEL